MSQENYIQQTNLFFEFGKRNGLTSYERIFWLALLHVANTWAQRNPDHDWPDDFFPVSNSEIGAWSGLEERNIRAIRNRFRQIGLIDFRKGDGRRSDPEYRIFYLRIIGYKIVPDNQTGSKNAPDRPETGNKFAPDCVSDSVGDCVRERNENGGKNVPDCASDPLYKSISMIRPVNININNGTVKANANAEGNDRPRTGGGFGLVNLDEDCPGDAELVAFPWRGGGTR